MVWDISQCKGETEVFTPLADNFGHNRVPLISRDLVSEGVRTVLTLWCFTDVSQHQWPFEIL